jgi:phage FluMu gp28-like protein
MTLISSHSHPETTFARICQEAKVKKNPFSLHSTTLPEAVEQGLALKIAGEHLRKLKRRAA